MQTFTPTSPTVDPQVGLWVYRKKPWGRPTHPTHLFRDVGLWVYGLTGDMQKITSWKTSVILYNRRFSNHGDSGPTAFFRQRHFYGIKTANQKPLGEILSVTGDGILNIWKVGYSKARELKTGADIADWNAGKITMLVAHPASCGRGINLQGAEGSSVCWLGLPWSLELYQQANARIHRQGVKHTVVIHHLLVDDSIDQDVMAALADKATGQATLLNALKHRVAA